MRTVFVSSWHQTKGNDMTALAFHESNALAYLVNTCQVPATAARDVLSHAPVASRFSGAKYYYPDDLEAIADCYHDEKAA